MHPRQRFQVTAALVGVSCAAALAAPLISFKRPARDEKATPANNSAGVALPATISFNEHIQPILSEYCYHCHGPDSGSRKAGLRLDRAEFAFQPRSNGVPVIVASNAAASDVVRRITSKDPTVMMPPADAHKTLKPEEVALLVKWIQDGAVYQEHWSFIPPARTTPPEVRNAKWVRNDIDRFILARLEKEGLDPNGDQEKRRLIRRVTLDLTGLPPTPAEVEAFVADTSPDAYEKVVDRLLASPRYGEHMARFWLDSARYADTHGIHIDNYRSIWPYRDWVIKALNDNMPFDRFTIEQLAGDLLPSPTRDQRIATGFNRCLPTTSEGGAIAEEYEAIYAKDRVETTAATWMGLTMGCASCHDHKFDPISMKDFYRFAAYFRNSTQPAMDGNIAETPPVEVIPAAADVARWDAIDGEIAAAKKAVAERRTAALKDLEGWVTAQKAKPDLADVSAERLLAWLKLDEGDGTAVRDSAPGTNRTYAFKAEPEWVSGPKGTGVKWKNGTAIEIGDVGAFEATDSFSYGAWVQVPEGSGALLARMDEGNDYRGWDLWFESGKAAVHLISKWDNDTIKLATKKPLKPNTWTHVFVTYDGSRKAAGVRIYVDGVEQMDREIYRDQLGGSIKTDVPLVLGRRSHAQGFNNGQVRDVRLYGRRLESREVAQLAARDNLKELLALEPGKRTKEQRQQLETYYLENVDAAYRELDGKMDALVAEKDAMRKRAVVTLVSVEKGEPAFAHVLTRGAYDQKAEKVYPGVPAVLPKLPADAPTNRLALARWLVAPEHPLAARVVVNRYWQQLFGAGIVASSEDFGITGQRPSHPALLDWLAVEFRESGWNTKHMLRLMALSSTYRQAPNVTQAKLEKDPRNRLLARGPRYRMDAEMLRDLALSTSGLLVEKLGGPSVKPYQPDGIWETVAMPQSNTRFYKRDAGENLYRRSLYSFWKRSAPLPNMEIFNAPARETNCQRRERTNTPLQALVTMNDVQFVEAARNLAQRAIKEAGADEAARLDYIGGLVLARPFVAEEKQILGESLKAFRAGLTAETGAATNLIAFGESKADAAVAAPELSAWTLVASQILNLDEALNK